MAEPDINPLEVEYYKHLLELQAGLEKQVEDIRQKHKELTEQKTSIFLREKVEDIASKLAAGFPHEDQESVKNTIKAYLNDEAARLATFYYTQYENKIARLAGRAAMLARNISMGTMTFGDVWHNLWSNIWTFIFGPWVLGSAFVFLQFLFIGAFITTVTGSSLLLLWLAPVAGGAGVFFLNFQSSKSPMDWLTHFISGAMISYSSAIFWVAIFASISNFPGGTTWFWITVFLSGLFIGTFQLYQLGGFRAVLQVSVLILLFGYIALGPYQAVYRSTIDKVKEPLAFAFTSVKNAVRDVWLLTTNPTEWYARQQIKNVRSESPLEFPKGIEFVSLEPLIPSVGIPAGEEFSVVAVIQNKGRLRARDIYIRAECNQWCEDKDQQISGLKTDASGKYIKELKPGDQDRITVSKLTALKVERNALQFAKVTVFVSYSYSTNSTLPVKIASSTEIDRAITAKEDVFRPILSIATQDSPAQLSLNVGPQPLKASDDGSLLVAVLNARTDGDVILKTGDYFSVNFPKSIGKIKIGGCRGRSQNVKCTPPEDKEGMSQTMCSMTNDITIKGSEFSSILPVFCGFTTSATEVFKSDRIRAELPRYTFVTKKSTEVLITQPLGAIIPALKISSKPNILSPKNGETIQTLTPTFRWEAVKETTCYRADVISTYSVLTINVNSPSGTVSFALEDKNKLRAGIEYKMDVRGCDCADETQCGPESSITFKVAANL